MGCSCFRRIPGRKTLTDASSALSGFFSTSARDQYNRRLEKAVAQFDIPHRAVIAFNYELPIGPASRSRMSRVPSER